jgi:hypothetical protein
VSLYLTELKVKTALAILQCIKYRDAAASYDEIDRVQRILHEIIDRPTEENNG